MKTKYTSNRNLTKWLNGADKELLSTLSFLLKSKIYPASKELKDYSDIKNIPKSHSDKREELAIKIISNLTYYGSHNVAYAVRIMRNEEPGVSYAEIVHDVAKDIRKQRNSRLKYWKRFFIRPTGIKSAPELPRLGTVSDYEKYICEDLMLATMGELSDVELIELLEGAGLGKEAISRAIKELTKVGLAGVGILFLVRKIGKKAISEIISQAIVHFTAKYIGKEAAKILAAKILKTTAQKTIAKIVSGIGWLLLAWDAVKLGDPAKRITIPVVVYIALHRTIERMNE